MIWQIDDEIIKSLIHNLIQLFVQSAHAPLRVRFYEFGRLVEYL